jgi:D-glycero-D-manno-heptose 1,7-bisphosphate phosphatase
VETEEERIANRNPKKKKEKEVKITPILFLDLDGTVRLGMDQIDHYVQGPEDVEIFPGVLEIIQSYKSKGWRIVTISNQGGIALDLVNSRDVARAMQETNRLCANLFDRMAWCTHHPNAIGDKYESKEEKSICFCRKPRIGMIVASMIELHEGFHEIYRPYACLMVGDRMDDKECANNANIPFMWAKEWRKRGPLV